MTSAASSPYVQSFPPEYASVYFGKAVNLLPRTSLYTHNAQENTMKTSEIVQYILGGILTIAVGAGAFIMSGIRGDIDGLRQDAKAVVQHLDDFRVEVAKTSGETNLQLGKTNQKLDDLIANSRK